MFAKLLVMIVVMGGVSGALLVNRQQRIETAHQAALLHQELIGQQQQLWSVGAELAAGCRPKQVRLAVDEIGGSWSTVVVADPERDSTATEMAVRSIALDSS